MTTLTLGQDGLSLIRLMGWRRAYGKDFVESEGPGQGS